MNFKPGINNMLGNSKRKFYCESSICNTLRRSSVEGATALTFLLDFSKKVLLQINETFKGDFHAPVIEDGLV